MRKERNNFFSMIQYLMFVQLCHGYVVTQSISACIAALYARAPNRKNIHPATNALPADKAARCHCSVILCNKQSYGCGAGIVGGRVGGWGIENEGGASVIRNGRKDGLAASVTLKSTACPFLYKVKVRSFPEILC